MILCNRTLKYKLAERLVKVRPQTLHKGLVYSVLQQKINVVSKFYEKITQVIS
jgi:hypothetical protein